MNIMRNETPTKRCLEIGPGQHRLDGFETLDIVSRPDVDHICDASKPMPFEDASFNLVYSSHVLEHIPWYKTEDTLREWVRVLAPGGTLEIWVPDAIKILAVLMGAEFNIARTVPEDGHRSVQNAFLWVNDRLLHGSNPTYPSWHKALFTYTYLEQLLTKVGLVGVRQMGDEEIRGINHGYIDLGISAIKPQVKQISYKTVEDLNNDIKKLAVKLPNDVDLVIGIPRSGLLAANLLALYLNVPITDVQNFCAGKVLEYGYTRADNIRDLTNVRSVVVIDDTVNTGTTMGNARQAIKQANVNYKIYYAAVYTTNQARDKVDYWVEIVDPPRTFEWGVWHVRRLTNACVDLDGVLCRDPLPYEDDDGELYRDFIRTVEPLCKPSYEIGWIVTARLEKYRDLTEEWLTRHDIRYRNLVMLNFPDKATRRRNEPGAYYKSDVYVSSKARLFIESSPILAQEIEALSGKPVLCLTDGFIKAKNDVDTGPLLRKFNETLAARARQIQSLQGQIENSLPIQFARRWDSLASRLFPQGTPLGKCYKLLIRAALILVTKGVRVFLKETARFCTGKLTQLTIK